MLNYSIKNGFLASAFLIGAIGFTACNNAGNNDRGAADEDYTAYRSYVTSVRDSGDRYYDRDWNQLDRDYNERKARVEAKKDKMDEKSRAEYDRMDKEWNDFKVRYDQHRAEAKREAEAKNAVSSFRSTLLTNASDETLSTVGANELAATYEHFYETVKANHKDYNEEQWNVVNSVYSALKARREALEDKLSKDDLSKIRKIQVNYEALKITNKPFADHDKH